jgi:transposase
VLTDTASPPAHGLTVRDVAARYRVSPDKVRLWILKGELTAVNTAAALCGKPRWVVLPDHLAEFERRRAGGPPPKSERRKKRTCTVDYYPDD